MRRMSQFGRLLVGGGLLTGIFGLLSLFTSAFEHVKEFKDAFEVYARYLRLPLARAFGLDHFSFAIYFLDAFILWTGLFLAVNAFVQRQDGLFVWGHIGQLYCSRERQTLVAQLRCILPKFGDYQVDKPSPDYGSALPD